MGAFDGKSAVITGGGSGVGAALALALAEAKANIHLIGRRLDKLEAVAKDARMFGAQATCHSADLASESGQLEVIRELERKLPRIDILIQNAAAYISGPIERAKLESFDSLYRTNVRAPYALAQAFLPKLKAHRGQIVFINSSGGVGAKRLTAQYDSTKHALKAIADSLRSEVNEYGVRILSVYLGRTASEMQERIHQSEGKPYRPEVLLQPTDVASIVMNALTLSRTAEITDIHVRPFLKT